MERKPSYKETKGDSQDARELKQWLAKSNCLQAYPKFVENGITMDLVPELDTESLKEIGIVRLGDRLRLELAISEMKADRLGTQVPVNSIYQLLNLQVSDSATSTLKPGDSNDASTLVGLNVKGNEPISKDSDKVISFILQDGSIKKINVMGCFNASSIKRKVLKRLGIKSQETNYDTYIHSLVNGEPGPVNVLFDVELVTICYSPDRLEKHRLIFCPKVESPSEAALSASLRVIAKFSHILSHHPPRSNLRNKLSQYHVPERGPGLRNFFGQRPPSELISSNLAEYFPDTHQRELEATVKNSVRHSVRLSRRIPNPNGIAGFVGSSSLFVNQKSPSNKYETYNRTSSIFSTAHKHSLSRTVGDIMVNNVNALDGAVLYNDNQSASIKSPSIYSMATTDSKSFTSGRSKASSLHAKVSVSDDAAGLATKRQSRIELISLDSDSDDAETENLISEYANSNELFEADGPIYWLQGARIGSGSFGTVYLGMNPITGELMAVKQVKLPDSNKENDSRVAMFEALQREMTILKGLNHENIVRYLGSSSDNEHGLLNIFIEYVPGGSVQSMLLSYGPFEEPLIRNFVRQVTIGLSYLHGEDIIHRDIKGANILIDIKGTVKISDFGISKKLNGDMDNESRGRRASLQGSVYWMAPEVVKQTTYTKKADIWSVGCLVVEMFTGNHPFPDFSQMQAIFKIGTHIIPQIPEWCTLEAREFLSKTFEIDYDLRPNAVDLLSEPFMNSLIMSKK